MILLVSTGILLDLADHVIHLSIFVALNIPQISIYADYPSHHVYLSHHVDPSCDQTQSDSQSK